MYTSTRGHEHISASAAILKGIAADKGLFTPLSWGFFSFSEADIKSSYALFAKKVFAYFLDDFTAKDIDLILKDKYDDHDFNHQVTGLKKINNFHLLTLYHGRTFAFKDMALSVISSLIKQAKIKQNSRKKALILTATSGDTGSATLSGFNDDPDTDVIVLYPYKMISHFQESQMHYFRSKKNHVIAIDGNFDDCQNIAKEAFAEIHLKHLSFSSANSINIARIIAQVVYYFYSYLRLVESKEIMFGETINYCVPTGNFGNILAGYFAKKMGLPVNKLIVASNQNNVLTDFFNTGIYDSNRHLLNSISPSMDILISSNLERLLFMLSDMNTEKIKKMMQELKTSGRYELDEHMKRGLTDFSAFDVSESETKKTIKSVYEQYHVIVDPHTAVGIEAYNKYTDNSKDQKKTIIVSTASPIKFSESVLSALSLPVSNDDFKNIEQLISLNKDLDDRRYKKYLETKIELTSWKKAETLAKLKKLVGDLDVDN